ncbi:MAG: YbjQ family protein [Nevskiales bacterium]
MENYIDLIVFLALLAAGYVFGSIAESQHYRSIRQREKAFLRIAAVPSEIIPSGRFETVGMVCGNVVISVDYFKRFTAALRNLTGGRVSAYETLLDRARREAVLRMKDAARRQRADMVLNMRLETSAVGSQQSSRQGIACVEVLAYGTAVKRISV